MDPINIQYPLYVSINIPAPWIRHGKSNPTHFISDFSTAPASDHAERIAPGSSETDRKATGNRAWSVVKSNPWGIIQHQILNVYGFARLNCWDIKALATNFLVLSCRFCRRFLTSNSTDITWLSCWIFCGSVWWRALASHVLPARKRHPHVTLLPSSPASVPLRTSANIPFRSQKLMPRRIWVPLKVILPQCLDLESEWFLEFWPVDETSAPFAVCCDYQQSVGSGFNQSVL